VLIKKTELDDMLEYTTKKAYFIGQVLQHFKE
jgi:hypothetical protein